MRKKELSIGFFSGVVSAFILLYTVNDIASDFFVGEECSEKSKSIDNDNFQRRQEFARPEKSYSERLLSSDAKKDLIDNPVEGLDRKVVKSYIKTMEDHQIKEFIAKFSNLDEQDLQSIGDVKKYSERLVDIGFSSEASNFEGGDVSSVSDVYFSADVFNDGIPKNIATSFSVSEDAIYANISMPPDTEIPNSVFVKWVYAENNEVVLFDSFTVDSSNPNNYVWLNRNGGWLPGEYRVEFYRNNQDVNPLGSGVYKIFE